MKPTVTLFIQIGVDSFNNWVMAAEEISQECGLRIMVILFHSSKDIDDLGKYPLFGIKLYGTESPILDGRCVVSSSQTRGLEKAVLRMGFTEVFSKIAFEVHGLIEKLQKPK